MPTSFGLQKFQTLGQNGYGSPMVLEIDTTKSAGTTYDLNFFGNGTPNYTVSWGDGTSTNYTTYNMKSKTYAVPGIYRIEIRGRFNNGGIGTVSTTTNTNLKKLTKVISFGNLPGVVSLYGLCQQSSVTSVPAYLPSTITSLAWMFANCSTFNDSNICSWNTENVTDIRYMFYQAYAFNQPIGTWNTSKVTTMNDMFNGATSFNQPIGAWNTSTVNNMASMFNGATSFNQPVGAWDVSSVTNMYQMFFNNTVFNQPVNTWNVSNVQNFGRLFRGAGAFNQSVSSWNTSSATDYFEMFTAAPSFNQPIGHFSVTQRPRIYSIFPLVSGLSTENYSRTLIGWANQIANSGNDYSGKCLDSGGAVPSKYDNINYGGSPYNNAAAARAFLVDVNSISKTNNNQRNIACSSNGLICLSGNIKGYLQKSTDGGVNWTNLTSVGTSTTSWRCVAMSADGTYMAACITSGAVYTSSDGGANWTLRSGAGNRSWGGIAISSDGTKLAAVVVPGFIYTSSDSGATWTQRGISANYNSISMSSDGTKLVTCSQNTSTNGYIFTSGDSGATWTARVTDANRSWGSCACSSDGTIMYATEAFNNTVRKSTDSGATWTSLGIAQLQGQPRAVTCSADGSRLIIVTRGSGVTSAAGIGYSSNGGTSFIFQNIGTSGTNTTLKAIVGAYFDLWVFAAMSDDGQRIIMRPNGLNMGCPMVYSTDTGATWNAATLTGYTGANWTVLDGGAA